MMNIPDEYKVENLFLLVGENPLPNYVAARTLLKEGGTVYLVFTNQTINQKDCLNDRLSCLNDKLNREIICEELDLANDESNACEIRDIIQDTIKSIKTESVGLNYTGGTKAMAVHAYRAMKEFKPNAVFSYLDPRRLKMFIDRENNQPRCCDVPLELSLEELFKLHNNNYWLENKPPVSQPCLPEVAAKFAEFYADKQLAKYWREWCDEKLRPSTRNEKNKWKKQSQLEEVSISLNDLPHKIKDILCLEFDASSEEFSLNNAQKKGFNKCEEVCKWLDGIWLENYVLHQVKEIQDQADIKECGMSFLIRDPKNPKKDRFEFDVALIKGYQLFAISCTTTSIKGLCKQKLFEAHLRARQLGGDEARVALVCCSDEPEEIREDMRFAINDRKIKVFGRNDLVGLANKMKIWIDEVKLETKQ
ncbi:MAG: DUF1887 family CARF protein [Microcoleaceae cyanobacterium]